MSTAPYHYRGISDADVPPGVRPDLAARIPGNWFTARVNDALAQAATARPEHRAGHFKQAREVAAAMTAAAALVESKCNEVERECPPPDEPAAPRKAK